jgi:hypothetical protein
MAIANLVRRIVLVVGVLAIGAAIALGQRRTWRDDTGRFSVEAELVETKQDNVLLKRVDGTTITAPLARLSAADRDYLKNLARPETKSSGSDVLRPNLAFPDAMNSPPSWNDANTPFDLAAFLKAPPPEENAAPLYLDALYEFAPAEMVSILYPKVPFEELAKRGINFSLGARYEKEMQLDEAWKRDPKSVDVKEVDNWLASYDRGFEKLVAAQLRPTCMFQPGRSVHSLWSHVHASRQVLRVVQWRTRRDVQRGDLERPLRDLKMVLRLTRDLQVRGCLAAVLVGFALDYQSCELVGTILNAPGITAGHCDRLLALLTEHEPKSIDALVEGNRGEYILSRQALHDLQLRTGSFDPKFMKDSFGMRGDVNSPLACLKLFDGFGISPEQRTAGTARLMSKMLPGALQGGKVLSDADYAKEVSVMNAYFASILKLAGQPGFLLRGEAGIKAAEEMTAETALVWRLIPPNSALLAAIRRGKTHVRGAECLVALRRWQLEHREAPSSLETLVKAAGMAQVPLDPYSDQPLLLGSVAGNTVIYSVAADGKDDKAQIEWKFAPDQPGDFIFRLDAVRY